MKNTQFTWWLTSLARTIVWAGLRVLPGGTAEVIDSDGNLMSYDSEDTARAQLMDAGFVELGGMDEDDAQARGFSLEELQIPTGTERDVLHAQLLQSLPPQQ